MSEREPTIADVLTAVGRIQTDVTTLQGEIASLRDDATTLRGEVAGLRGEVAGLQGEVGGLRGEVVGLRADTTVLQGEVASLRADTTTVRTDLANLQQKHDSLRAELMARMDRLQDAATTQSRDIEALLELMVTTQRIAEQGRDGIRSAQDVGAHNTTVITELLKRVRQLETDVRELRDKPSSATSHPDRPSWPLHAAGRG